MKEIVLSNGGIALIDDEDSAEISKHNWYSHKDGNVLYGEAKYYDASGKRKNLKMHHLILPCPKGMQTDHIDGNGLNNQRSNLRIVSHRENQWNRHTSRPTTSKYLGVCFDKHSKKYIASIYANGKHQRLGSFINEFEAFKTYVVATVVLVGAP